MGEYRSARIPVLRKRGALAPSRFTLLVVGNGGLESCKPRLATSVIASCANSEVSVFLGVPSS